MASIQQGDLHPFASTHFTDNPFSLLRQYGDPPKMKRLPPEVMDNILSKMRPVIGSHDADSKSEAMASRRTLLSFAKSSRLFYGLAICHLYHTIILDDLISLFRFLRTIARNGGLAKIVQVLWVSTCLGLSHLGCDDGELESNNIIAEITPDDEAYAYLERCFGGMPPQNRTWKRMKFDPGPDDDDYGSMGESALALVFCLATGIHTLHLDSFWAFGTPDPFNTGKGLLSFFDHSHRDGFPLLENLDTLVVSVPEGVYFVLEAENYQSLMRFGKIRHLQLSDPEWKLDYPEHWSSVRTLRLVYLSSALLELPEWLEKLHQQGARLATLDLIFDQDADYGWDMESLFPQLSTCIVLYAATLQNLTLVVDDADSTLRAIETLECLPKLRSLKTLHISIAFLLSFRPFPERPEVWDALPESLEVLSLEQRYTDWTSWRRERKDHGHGHGEYLKLNNRKLQPGDIREWGMSNHRGLPLWEGFQELARNTLLQLVFHSGHKLFNLGEVRVALQREAEEPCFVNEKDLVGFGTVSSSLLPAGRRPFAQWERGHLRIPWVDQVCCSTVQAMNGPLRC
ncbi:hypothetical protein OQA88_5499 [Cercophora sp. LCS_1]